MSGTVHIVGAGLAGLSAAVSATGTGASVHVHEAAPQPGGRCRTFHDPRLDRMVDNGNHLVLTGNHAVRGYLRTIGAEDRMRVDQPEFPFVDLASGARWCVRLNEGRVPWWMAVPGRRIGGTRLAEYLGAWRLPVSGPQATVAEAIPGRGPLWHRFWEPVTWAVLNTTPERGQARLLWRVLSETFLKGAADARPMFAPAGLGTALVDPAVAWLTARGQRLDCGKALAAVETSDNRVTGLRFAGGETVGLGAADRVILALPPTRLRSVAPWADPPDDAEGILNAHFTVADLPPGLPSFLGLTGALTHWIFVKGDVISLTVSAAGRLGHMDRAPDDLVPVLWEEVQQALGFRGAFAAARINKERRATFDQSPEGVARRMPARTPITNLYLAGDATDTGLPATIEGAIRSGQTAAVLAEQGDR